MSVSNEELEHYKARYTYYKDRCAKFEKIFVRFGELLKEKPAAAALPSPILRSSPIKLAVVTMSASPMHSSCALKEEETPISPILGKNHALKAVRKRLFECNKVEPPSDENEEEQETSEYDLNFEPGSNKWECVDMESFTTSEDKIKAPRRKQTPEVAGIFQRLRAIPKYSGLEMRPPGQVSTKIKGVKRRQLPGWCCTNCEEYYKAAGINDPAIVNRCSRHRSVQPRVRSPKGYWLLDLEEQRLLK